MKVRIIVNPISGGGKGPLLGTSLHSALRAHNIDAEIITTGKAGDAHREAREPGCDCVVSVGGDGTTNEIANAIAGTDTLLAILPLGTANVVARELRIPRNPEFVADCIARRMARPIDAGCCGERLFLLGCGAGLDAEVVARIHASRGRKLSYAAYVVPTVKTLFTYDYPKIRVAVDGQEVCVDGEYVIVANCRNSAGVFTATPKAKIDDGLLDVCIVKDLSVLKVGWLIVLSMLPGFADRRAVTYRQGRHVELLPAGPVPVPLQIDGDPAGTIPATFVVQPHALRVVAPHLEL